MRWITYLESNKEAYQNFEEYLEAQIEFYRKPLEDTRSNYDALRVQQGSVKALRQIQYILKESQKESQSHGYGTDQQTRAGPS